MNKVEISSEQLYELKDHYDKGLFLQAYYKAIQCGPLKNWTGCDELIFLGQLVYNLGAPRFSRFCIRRGFRQYPHSLLAYIFYLNEIYTDYGPIAAWSFLKNNPIPSSNGDDDALMHLYTTRAAIAGQFRDFTTAENF
ncbi:MAG: hypothetical protein JXJ04_22380, partial [Spirochaetales bacterium]|nr:hypothetical protein [Spirochaetales bacterium]